MPLTSNHIAPQEYSASVTHPSHSTLVECAGSASNQGANKGIYVDDPATLTPNYCQIDGLGRTSQRDTTTPPPAYQAALIVHTNDAPHIARPTSSPHCYVAIPAERASDGWRARAGAVPRLVHRANCRVVEGV